VHAKTALTGATVGLDVTASQKIWKTFQSLGDIAFAYTFSNVLIEIQVKTLHTLVHRAASSSRSFGRVFEKYLKE
jgi:hypothetical protein